MKKIICIATVLAALVSPADMQSECQKLIDDAVARGEQCGVQFCAYRHGKKIVDVFAGTLSTREGAAAVRGDSLFPIFSTEKPLLATAVHRVVEKGLMDYDKPLCTWWPELKGDGKEKLTLRETLGYRSGLPGGGVRRGFPPMTSSTGILLSGRRPLTSRRRLPAPSSATCRMPTRGCSGIRLKSPAASRSRKFSTKRF